MKLVFAFLILSTASFAVGHVKRLPANVSKLSVDCSSPKNFAGLSASASGVLKLSSLTNGAAKGMGKIKIQLLNPRKPWSGEVSVMGQYDDLTSVGSERYFHGGATIKNNNDIMVIYINFTNPDMSYIEYANSTYKMTCK